MQNKQWVVTARRADYEGLAKKLEIDPVLVRLMANRGLKTEEQMRRYLYGDLSLLHDPHLLKDIDKAVEIIEDSIKANELIAIVSDYDVDGIFSGELLLETFSLLGSSAIVRTPNRVIDGYGLNERIINECYEAGAKLVITCDNGISAFEAIDKANSLGMKCIVTDHHEVAYDDVSGEKKYRLPNALAIVDPKQPDCTYPFAGICGCVVAFKLAQILLSRADIKMPEVFYEYAAIATVVDVMQLVDENRILVKEGIKRLKVTQNIGLRALMNAQNIDPAKLRAYNFGYTLGPCFNSAGRLDTVDIAYNLLQAKTEREANKIAKELKALNDSRKALTEEGAVEAFELIENSDLKNDKILVVDLKDCHESLAGIIAGKVREHYNRPAIVVTETSDGFKGSGRSMEGYSMYTNLNMCKDLLKSYGGHDQAAGLSIEKDNLEAFRKKINEICTLTDDDLKPKLRLDVAMPISYINENLINQLQLLEPTGTGNVRPLFAEAHLKVQSAMLKGRDKNMLSLNVMNQRGAFIEAIMFYNSEAFINDVIEKYGEDEWNKALNREENNIEVSLAYLPSINDFMGVKTCQIIVQNYKF